jgi:hypothetical protein
MGMELQIICIPSAFKHNATEADIQWAFNTAKYDRLVVGFDNKYLLLGFDTKGNPLEVMYHDLGDGTVKVFHAMACRKELIPLMNE